MAVDEISISRLNELHPSVRDSAIRAYTKACKITPIGVHPFITETYRSFERSDKLYNQPWDGKDNDGDGKIDEPDEKVSNAKGGQSIHNYSLALDFVLQVNGKMDWTVNANWMKVIQCFKDEGWESGADWRSFKDYPHLEKRLGNSLKQIQAKYKAKDFIPGTNFINI